MVGDYFLYSLDMNFTIGGDSSFTLSMRAREPYYNICDCKELRHPSGEILDIYVDGTAYSFLDGEVYDSWSLMPYSGQIIVDEYTQYFSTGIPYGDRDLYIFSVHRGQWSSNYCKEFIYK